MWKYETDPPNPYAADTNHCQERRDEGDAKASHITAHHIVEQAERMRQHDRHKPDVSGFNDIGVAIEDSQQRFAKEKDRGYRKGQDDDPFHQAERQSPLATAEFPCTKVLAYKRGACLRERVEDIVGYDFNVERSAGSRHDYGTKAVYGRLYYYVRECEHCTLDPSGKPNAKNSA